MAAGVSIEILDLRHFAAPVLRPVLEAEGELWSERLHWDYRASARLLMQYLDNHLLPGLCRAGGRPGYRIRFLRLRGDRRRSSAMCLRCRVAAPKLPAPWTARICDQEPAREIEETLLSHLFETLLNSPNVDRIESQLLLHPSGTHAEIFRRRDSNFIRRHFMVQQLEGHWSRPRVDLPAELDLRPWRDDDLYARRPPDLGSLWRPSRQPHQRPVPLGPWLAAVSA